MDIDNAIHFAYVFEIKNEGEEVQSGKFDYEQIAKLRKRLPLGRSIAITESGVINAALTYEKLGQLEFIHMKGLSQQLQA